MCLKTEEKRDFWNVFMYLSYYRCTRKQKLDFRRTVSKTFKGLAYKGANWIQLMADVGNPVICIRQRGR